MSVDGQVSAPPDYPDDPDFLDRSSPDFGLRMRTAVFASLLGLASWAAIIAVIRRLLSR